MRQTNTFTDQELFFFCEQFSILLRSGISCAEGLSLMQEDSRTSQDKEFFQSLLDDFESNGSFALTLEHSGHFPDSLISYVRVGEETGCLDEVMQSLSRHYEQEIEISQNIKSAVAYPLLMLGMMGTIIVILLVKVLPVFKQVFEQMGLEMNHFSNGLFHVGTLISRYSAVLLGILLILIIIGSLFYLTPKGRILSQRLLLKLPHMKEILEAANYARLTQAIAMGIHSGLDPVLTLELAQSLLSHPQIMEKTQNACHLLEDGLSFEEALSASALFEGMNARLIVVGFRSGTSDEVMNTLSHRYREHALTVTNNLISTTEPTIVIIFSLLIGLVLLSVMMPLLGILSEIMV